MKKIINPWEGLDGYMCFGCAPSNPMGLHGKIWKDTIVSVVLPIMSPV